MSAISKKYHPALARIGLLYAAAIWGSTFVIVKDALEFIDPLTLLAYRFLISGLIMWIGLAITGRSLFTNFRMGMVLGLIIFSLYVPQTIGLGITSATNSAFITGLFVAFVPLFLLLLFKRRPFKIEVVASGLSLAGLWVLTGGMREVNAGDLLTLIAAMTYALHLLYSDRYLKRGVDPYVISCQQFLFVGVLSLVAALVFDRPLDFGTVRVGWIVLFLALFPTLSAFVIQMVAQRIVTPLTTSLVFALEPVFAAIFAWTIGGETFIMRSGVGGGLIFLALVISGMASAGKRLKTKSNK